MGHENRSADAMDGFLLRLTEAVAWCARHGSVLDPRNSLRTTSLQPTGDLFDHTVNERQQLVSLLTKRRTDRLREESSRSDAAVDLTQGRLLVFDRDASLSDGYAEIVSGGFFDADNAPPWDTWLCYVQERESGMEWQPFDSYLVSWVPPQFVERAWDGIDGNPEGCIVWATELQTAFTARLQAIGHLR